MPLRLSAPARRAASNLPITEDVTTARRLFIHGRYDQLRQTLSVLLPAVHGAATLRPAGAGGEARLLVSASRPAVKQGRVDDAAACADTAVTMARRSGRPGPLAAAARTAATPLRRSGRTGQALWLPCEAHPPERHPPQRAGAGRGRDARPDRRLHRPGPCPPPGRRPPAVLVRRGGRLVRPTAGGRRRRAPRPTACHRAAIWDRRSSMCGRTVLGRSRAFSSAATVLPSAHACPGKAQPAPDPRRHGRPTAGLLLTFG